MKKYYFLTFTYLFIVLLPVCSSAQFVITAVKSGSGGIPPSGVPIPIPIDTIRPGLDFGIRIIDPNLASPSFAFELTTVKLDEDKKSPTFGAWIPDISTHIYPNINLITDMGSCFTTDSAFYKLADSTFMSPFKNVWVRIVMKSPPPPTGSGVGLDSSKPLLVLAGPIDSSQHTIVVYPNPMGAASPTTEISILWPHSYDDKFEIKIFDTFGYLVKDLLPDVKGINTGRYMYAKWDGKNTKGKKVANGVYLICVKVMEGGKEAAIWKQKIGVAW
jgi:hypothetical protein